MRYSNDPLWIKIRDFNLDDPESQLTLSSRLSRENGWSKALSDLAILEYKKYLYLVAKYPMTFTPSDKVDQVWHMHMIYTRSYWEDLCRDTLGKNIHHGPTKGGSVENLKYKNFYSITKSIYAEVFGEEPTPLIWESDHDRFHNIDFVRVNLGENFVIPKTLGLIYLGVLGLIFILSLIL
jgi:hypothetical protein